MHPKGSKGASRNRLALRDKCLHNGPMPARRAGREKARGAVSLTYDGTSATHLHDVLPVLEAHGLHGTFYANPTALLDAPQPWRKVWAQGHEIGNHSLFELADADGLLPETSPDAIYEDVRETERLLEELFPGTPRSLAMPAVRGFTETLNPTVPPILRASIIRLNDQTCKRAASLFEVVRSPHDGLNRPGDVLLGAVRTMVADGMDTDSLCLVTEIAMSQRAWIVFVFDGLRDHPMDRPSHDAFCKWLGEHRQQVEVLPVVRAAEQFRPKTPQPR